MYGFELPDIEVIDNVDLVFLARVFLFSALYNIPGLEELMVALYRDLALVSWHLPEFPESIELVYNNTFQCTSPGLRRVAIEVAAENSVALFGDNHEFQETFERCTGFAKDLARELNDRIARLPTPTRYRCQFCNAGWNMIVNPYPNTQMSCPHCSQIGVQSG